MLLISIAAAKSQIKLDNQYSVNLDNGWKFKTGDNAEYALPDFNDSEWKSIKVDKLWQI
jgi:hypothetical protein